MIYSYYRVLDKSDNLVFECISNNADSHQVCYEDEYWTLNSLLYSYFFDVGFFVCKVEFTTKELNDWLLQRADNKVESLKSQGFIVNKTSN